MTIYLTIYLTFKAAFANAAPSRQRLNCTPIFLLRHRFADTMISAAGTQVVQTYANLTEESKSVVICACNKNVHDVFMLEETQHTYSL